MKYAIIQGFLLSIAFGQSFPPAGGTGSAVVATQTCVASGASGTAYTCSTSPTFTPAAGTVIYLKADVANTSTTPTVNVNSTSAITIKKQQGAAALAVGDISAGAYVELQYNGTNWILQSQSAISSAHILSVTQWASSNTPQAGTLNKVTPTGSYSTDIVLIATGSSLGLTSQYSLAY